jgi:hypothetical protein
VEFRVAEFRSGILAGGTPIPRLLLSQLHHTTDEAPTSEIMAIISANAMIRSLALFHLTLAALLIKNPKLIANQSVIMVLGGSMQLVRATNMQ